MATTMIRIDPRPRGRWPSTRPVCGRWNRRRLNAINFGMGILFEYSDECFSGRRSAFRARGLLQRVHELNVLPVREPAVGVDEFNGDANQLGAEVVRVR